VVREIEHATREINHIAGELTVRIFPTSSMRRNLSIDGLKSHSYSTKSTLARNKKYVGLSLKSHLVLQIVPPVQTFPLEPFTALDPVFPLRPVPVPDPVPPLWDPQSLPIALCMRAGRVFADHALGR